MRVSQAAFKPYARAVHDLARERQQVEAVARDLQTIADVVEGDAALRDFFGRPWVSASAKRAAAMEIAARLDVSPLVRDFVGLVARAGRAQHLGAIAMTYRGLVDEDFGRVRARVRTRVPLSDAARVALRARLGSIMGAKQVIVEEDVDGSLLGGFVAEIGTYIVDGSLDGQLARIGDRLKQA